MITDLERDPLTGFLTRPAIADYFEHAMKAAIHENQVCTLAYLDIDNFMQINTEYGHEGGDLVLQSVSDVIRQHAEIDMVPKGSGNVAGRYGGDEFTIFFPQTEREQAFLILERIRSILDGQQVSQNDAQQLHAHVTISVGIASYPNDGNTVAEILRKADQALYKAKKLGRNTICLAYEERMIPKTAHFTATQLERLSHLAEEQGIGEAVLLREALDDLLSKYAVTKIEKPQTH